ncbi:UDP-glycosyltransferase 83A1 [Dichanthelium oligosanthes]|uniref:UDP-glycosyltransferase 83A1 n=1 Tax=Dichanthelium oligosanthes TaxID=888268 RepID=A0A1E5UJQ7_9POAL|nr:UDP-glycosyltransferase 83A1 [Dichanthelium oligosanthes]
MPMATSRRGLTTSNYNLRQRHSGFSCSATSWFGSRPPVMAAPHILALPFPAQGHVIPLMQLSHRLVEHGIEVTFVNTEANHALALDAMRAGGAGHQPSLDGIHLVGVPDGLADGDDRKDLGKIADALSRHMPCCLEELVGRAEASGGTKISWLIADEAMGWAFEAAKKLGIRAACFWAGSVAFLDATLRIPQLIQDGVIDEKGWPKRQEMLKFAPGMPPLHSSRLPWNNAGAPEGQPAIFQLILRNNEAKDLAEVIVCNSFRDAEPGAFELYPDILPVGPLFADLQFKKPIGQFLPEDTGCLEWLDEQPDRSVMYVAFGSFTVFNPRQFEELALGLELTGRPFLWVVRPDFAPSCLSKAWLDEFQRRVGGTGMIVCWCPQQQVLAHRAVACFVSHCGWNSTMEGVRNSLPFLCWPYFTDQFQNESYICSVWRTGLAVAPGADGVVTKEELSGKVERVLGDDGIRERGHVIPIMELSHCLVEHGVKVTFVNTELNHCLILGALATKESELDGIDMVSVPDGLGCGEDRKDLARLTDSFMNVMPGELEKLVGRINADARGRGRISWLIADVNMAWVFPVAKRLGLRAAGFCPSSAAMFATRIKIPEMIRDGVLDEGGWPRWRGTFQLAPAMPPIYTSEFSWNRAGDAKGQPVIFQLILRNNAATHLAEIIVCNSIQELEHGAFTLFPRVLPVGPLSSDKPVGSFWAEDPSCAAWLDAHPASSVVYVAFGSFAAYDTAQLVEIAEGLALTSRPFLWVVRPGSAGERLLEVLRRRAEPRGRVVSWCPQRRVLAHPSVACFLTHCGWNSTMEAAANGVPLLCWPYFTDQFLNQSYICDVWRTGIKVPRPADTGGGTGTGLVGRDVVRGKVEELLGDKETKARALALRDLARRAVGEDGSSRRNLKRFVDLGHVMPLIELSHRLVDNGIEVYFVNTDFNHARIIRAMEGGGGEAGTVPAGIHMVSFPDGMGPDGDRANIGKLAEGLPAAMLGRLEELIRSKGIRWMVVDVPMIWALELAAMAGVRIALFLPFSAAVFALRLHVPRMIEDGIIDENGSVKRNEMIQLSPKMPAVDAGELPWSNVGKTPESRRLVFQTVIKTNTAIALADTIVCNTFQKIESEALALVPKTALAVGPLEATEALSVAGSFWLDDPTCLAWLDAQAPGSVVYVAFGSLAVLDATRLQELADGLALTGRPFLWVVRPNFAPDGVGDGWLDEFRRRVGRTGLVVGWAPQQRVLAHPSVACFLTHCGWNSIMEGARHGVRFLCWPYFGDQFCNRSYVCDVWRTGVRLCADDRGVVTKEEVREKVERLLGDEGIRSRALLLESAARESVAGGGSSHQNLLRLVDLLREQ